MASNASWEFRIRPHEDPHITELVRWVAVEFQYRPSQPLFTTVCVWSYEAAHASLCGLIAATLHRWREPRR